MTELHEYTAVQQRDLLAKREIRPTDLVNHYLGRIGLLNPTVHALTAVTPDLALARAHRLEEEGANEIPSREEAPLWGLPFADKDLNDRAGVPSSYGSRAFRGYMPNESAPIVIDMDSAGGVSLGKTNVPEFGFPAYARNLLEVGSARNPWDLDRDPGGSSSGAAVAVATRMLPFAPGNDAGGSVRIPATACGLVGLKPSRGRVPGESGIGSLAGLAVGGPIARTVADTALLLDGMCHGADRYALRAPSRRYSSYEEAVRNPIGPLKIGWNTWSPWAQEYSIMLDPSVEQVFEETLQLAERLGHHVEKVDPGPHPTFVESFRAVWMGGAAALPLTDEMLEAVEPLTAWLVRTGRGRPAAELPAALANLVGFEASIIEEYRPYDLVLTPSLATMPVASNWFDQTDGERNFIQQCQFTPYTSYLNVSGLPAITLPVSGEPLPIGVQAIGRPGDEETLLRFGAQLEAELRWEDRVPLIAQ